MRGEVGGGPEPTLPGFPPELLSKLCRDCGEHKERGAFARNSAAPDGLCYSCKACQAARRIAEKPWRNPATKEALRRNQAANAERNRTRNVHAGAPKRCSACGETKPRTEFYRQNGTRDGLMTACKSCVRLKQQARWAALGPEQRREHADRIVARYWADPEKGREKNRQWKEQNPEKARASHKRWRENNPEKVMAQWTRRRARLTNAPGRGVSAREWRATLEHYGHRCLCCGRDDERPAMDHVVPLVEGGAHEVENVQPLCGSCNSRKGARTVDYRDPDRHAALVAALRAAPGCSE